MGYSIVTPVKSKKVKVIMKAFMEKNFRPWSILYSGYDYDHSRFGDDLDYGWARSCLGFDCHSATGEGERDYIFAVCRWMSLRVGEK